MEYLIPIAVLAVVAVGPIWFWARRIEKRIGPPSDRPGHDTKRFQFKFGGEPPIDGPGSAAV